MENPVSTRHAAVNDTASTTEGVVPEGTIRATTGAASETLVVAEPPPAPDYARYRIEPGTCLRLSGVDPDESEQFSSKQDIKAELGKQRERIRDLQARLYAEGTISIRQTQRSPLALTKWLWQDRTGSR